MTVYPKDMQEYFNARRWEFLPYPVNELNVRGEVAEIYMNTRLLRELGDNLKHYTGAGRIAKKDK